MDMGFVKAWSYMCSPGSSALRCAGGRSSSPWRACNSVGPYRGPCFAFGEIAAGRATFDRLPRANSVGRCRPRWGAIGTDARGCACAGGASRRGRCRRRARARRTQMSTHATPTCTGRLAHRQTRCVVVAATTVATAAMGPRTQTVL
eukprot:6714644-Prymnesium_polylepis.1